MRTVYAAGVISGVAWWNEGYGTPTPSTVFGVTLNTDAEDSVKRQSGDALKRNRW